jgi:radical SAM protein with 4Fe4S-binding SPASM domain
MIVLWRITEQCNLACGYCAYDRTLAGPRQTVSVELVRRIGALLGEYQQDSGDPVLLSWLGGEPFLWPPLLALSQQLQQDFGLRISATSNGSTLHLPKVQEAVLKSFTELTLSVDGLADWHEQVRGVAGSWQRLKNSLQTLAQARTARQLPLKLRANVVLMRDNVAAFSELCLELAQWGLDEITFNQLGGRDRPEYYLEHSLRVADTEALAALLPNLRHTLAQRGVRLCASEPYLERIQASARGEPLAVSDCAAGEQFLFIDERGQIAPCSFTTGEYGVALASVHSVADLRQLPQRFAAARRRQASGSCSDCPSNHVFAKFAG